MADLFIYRISQNENNWYDTYDSAVVVAKSPEDAANINPDGYGNGVVNERFNSWASKSENVTVEKIGVVTGDMGDTYKDGEVLVSSFNAG